MNFDLVPIRGKYRGMDRLLLGTDLYNDISKSEYDNLLEEYFTFLDYIDKQDMLGFNKTISFYKRLIQLDICSEIIVYHDYPIESIFGFDIIFLGIDIVHNMCESLLSNDIKAEVSELLNENGLCRDNKDIDVIILQQDNGNVEWTACYVYKVDVNVTESIANDF